MIDGPESSEPMAPVTKRLSWPGVQVARAAADVTAIVVAFMASYQLYALAIRYDVLARPVQEPEPYLVAGGLFGLLALLAFWSLGLYRDRGSVLNLWEYETALKGLALAAACFFALTFLLRLTAYSRLVVGLAIAVAMGLVLLERRVLAAVIGDLQQAGRLGRRAVIYGCGTTGRLVMKKIVQSPHLGRVVVGFLDDEATEGELVECRVAQGGPALRVPVLGRLHELPAVAAALHVDELFVTAGAGSPEQMREIFELAQGCGVDVAVVPRLGDLRVDQLSVEDLSAVPVLRLRQARLGRTTAVVKRCFDLAGATALGIVTAPVWIGAVLLLLVEGGGSVLFRHERVGLRGRRFQMIKFRTLRSDVDPYAPKPDNDTDPRVTRVGRMLRVTGLDELPQLINVLRGDMSLVGPRPEMPFIAEGYDELERERLRVKPGITGLWQVSGDRQAHIHENIEYDLYYVHHQSLLLDLLILMETAFFSASTVPHALKRRSAPRLELSTGKATAASLEHGGTWDTSRPRTLSLASGYALVALDQRGNGEVPRSWEHSIPAAVMLARHGPVKVLAAPPNRAAFDRLFAAADRGGEWEDRLTTYVSYDTRAQLRDLALRARLVLTDLPHVAAWAADAAVDVIWATPEGLRWDDRNRSVTTPAELSRWIGGTHSRGASAMSRAARATIQRKGLA